MTQQVDVSQDKPRQLYRALFEQKSVVLSTINAHGEPEISYAPYWVDNEQFYIFVSELASHTQNLLARPTVSLMLVKDESHSPQIFARGRLSFRCDVIEVNRDDTRAAIALESLQQRHGEVVGMLRQLADFRLLALKPNKGRLVMGFGKAYDVEVCQGLDESKVQLVHLGAS